MPTPDTSDDDAYFDAILQDCLQVGRTLVCKLPQNTEIPADRVADAYDRFTRSIRRSIMMCRDIAAGPATQNRRRTIARKQIIRAVGNAIETRAESPEHAERLDREFRERLDDPDLEEDIADRPVAALITEIRRDLGLANGDTFQWPRRAPEIVSQIAELAAAPLGAAVKPLPSYIDPAAAVQDFGDQPLDPAEIFTRPDPIRDD